MFCLTPSGEFIIEVFLKKNKLSLHAWIHSCIKMGVYVNLYKSDALKENVKFYSYLTLHIFMIISHKYF